MDESPHVTGRRRAFDYISRVWREIAKLGVCLALAELSLWLLGVDPIFRSAPPHPAVIGDPVLGWRYKPGHYDVPVPFSKEPRVVSYTFLEDGSRSAGRTGDGPRVALLGCSFMDGYGLDDTESIGWRLQQNLPDREISNLAVRGYGTYSSLLVMRRTAREAAQDGPLTFVYGFADFHAIRNIKNPFFQRVFGREGGAEGARGVYPVCDESRCFTWDGASVHQWWRISRLLNLVAHGWESAWFVWHQPLARRVTEGLLVAMSDEAREGGNRLIIAPVTELSDTWRVFFAERGFEVVSCVPEGEDSAGLLLDDGHPNARWTESFSECLAKYLRG